VFGVDVPLAIGVPAVDGAVEGDFDLESIVIVTGPYGTRTIRTILARIVALTYVVTQRDLHHGTKFSIYVPH
jgi:hypothetical protein